MLSLDSDPRRNRHTDIPSYRHDTAGRDAVKGKQRKNGVGINVVSYRPSKIISGGQTGVDMGGLTAARRLGIATGGCAPRGYRNEAGEQSRRLKGFGLLEHTSADYKERTKQNVIDSDATLILATDPASDGTQLTMHYCEEFDKPFLVVEPTSDAVAKIRKFIDEKKPVVLNIAGNRESKSKGIAAKTEAIIEAVFQ